MDPQKLDLDFFREACPYTEGLQRLVARYSELYVREIENDGRAIEILEIGTGFGATLSWLVRGVPRAKFITIDNSLHALIEARRRLSREGCDVLYLQAELNEGLRGLRDSTLDLVVSAFTLHNLGKGVRRTAMSEAYRLLRGGGTLIILDKFQGVSSREYYSGFARQLGAFMRLGLATGRLGQAYCWVRHYERDESVSRKMSESEIRGVCGEIGFQDITFTARVGTDCIMLAAKECSAGNEALH